jgi:Bacterial Ig-like domain (group 2)
MALRIGSRPAWVALIGVVLAGCGSENVNGPGTNNNPGGTSIASISLTSPIGDKMAAGRTVQLAATAADAQGNAVNATLDWSTSNDQVARVNASGLVTGVANGSATITASAEGTKGTVAMVVVNADLAGIDGVLGDAFTTTLVNHLPNGSRDPIETAVAKCQAGVADGHIINIEACIGAARTAMASPAGPDEQVLFAVLALMVDRAQRLLNL